MTFGPPSRCHVLFVSILYIPVIALAQGVLVLVFREDCLPRGAMGRLSPCPPDLAIGGIILGRASQPDRLRKKIGGRGALNQNVGARADKLRSSKLGL